MKHLTTTLLLLSLVWVGCKEPGKPNFNFVIQKYYYSDGCYAGSEGWGIRSDIDSAWVKDSTLVIVRHYPSDFNPQFNSPHSEHKKELSRDDVWKVIQDNNKINEMDTFRINGHLYFYYGDS